MSGAARAGPASSQTLRRARIVLWLAMSPGLLVVGGVLAQGAQLLALVLAAQVGRSTRDWRAAALAGGGPFFFRAILLTDFFRLRPESPALLLTWAGVFLFRSRHRLRIPGSAVLFFAAFATTFGRFLLAFAIVLFLATGRGWFDNAIFSMAANDVHPVRSFLAPAPVLGRSLWGLILALFERIAERYYELVAVGPHRTTALEAEVLQAVARGPYSLRTAPPERDPMYVFDRVATREPGSEPPRPTLGLGGP